MSYSIATVVVLIWAVIVTRFLYDGAVVMAGKLTPHRPTAWEVIFSSLFLMVWGIPTVLFLAIFGGVYWW